ncbi:MAG: cation diffusion facilitator family transporter [Candidatus Saccharimonadales bacterium]
MKPIAHKPVSDSRVVGTSFLVSISDVLLNLLVALFTGSVVILSQVLQGLSDLLTAGILYVGVSRSKRAEDVLHQFGYGREIFFWVIIAAIFMFFGTGGLSVYFGWGQLQNPQPVENIYLALLMLLFGTTTNAYSFWQSVKRLSQTEGSQSWWRRLWYSSMVEAKATFLIDLLGTLAAVFGLIALSLLVLTGDTRFDGIGAIVIGISMMTSAILLINDAHGLIVGRAVPLRVAERITNAALSVQGVRAVLDLRTMYAGSTRLLVILEVHLVDELTTDDIERLTDQIKEAVRSEVPHVHRVQVEVETPDLGVIARPTV